MKSFIFILTTWAGGGTEKVFENIASAVHKNFANVKIFLFVINGFDQKKYSVQDYVNLVFTRSELGKLAKIDEKIVINFSGDWKSGILARKISKKYISWVHQNPLTMKTARTAFLNFQILKKSANIVCVCKEQKEILQSKFHFKNQIDVIYNSVDFAKIESSSNVPLSGIDFKYILMTARIDFASKDFFTVVDSYVLLPKEIQKNYRLVFLGDGPDKEKLVSYIQEKVPHNLQENIILPGFDKNPYRWMKNASINILSSKTEGFSVSVIEAMSLGCPEIITDYKTGAKEISENGKNIALVKIGSAVEMEKAMKKIISDEQYRNYLVKNASEFVKQFYQENIEKALRRFFDSSIYDHAKKEEQ